MYVCMYVCMMIRILHPLCRVSLSNCVAPPSHAPYIYLPPLPIPSPSIPLPPLLPSSLLSSPPSILLPPPLLFFPSPSPSSIPLLFLPSTLCTQQQEQDPTNLYISNLPAPFGETVSALLTQHYAKHSTVTNAICTKYALTSLTCVSV